MSPGYGSCIPRGAWTLLNILWATLPWRDPVPSGPQQLPLGLGSPFLSCAARGAVGEDLEEPSLQEGPRSFEEGCWHLQVGRGLACERGRWVVCA